MAVLVEGISVIARRDAISSLYPKGWDAFVRAVPNETLCYDAKIARVGFMAPQDVQAFVSHLTEHGLTFLAENEAQDIAVVDQHSGPTTRCEWLEFAKIPFSSDGGTVAACWFCESPRIAAGVHFPDTSVTLHTPDGWTFEGSLSHRCGFIPNAQAASQLVFLRNANGVSVYVDQATGKEIYVGRTSAKPRSAAVSPVTLSSQSQVRAMNPSAESHKQNIIQWWSQLGVAIAVIALSLWGVSWALRYHLPKDLSELRRLSMWHAKSIANKKPKELRLYLDHLSPSVADVLVRNNPMLESLNLGYLTDITPQLARALIVPGRNVTLLLPEVRALTRDTAAVLREAKGLVLRNVVDIDEDVATELASGSGEIILGLTTLGPEVATALASKPAGKLSLECLTSLSPESALALSQVPAERVDYNIWLEGLTTLSDGAAKAIFANPRISLSSAVRDVGVEKRLIFGRWKTVEGPSTNTIWEYEPSGKMRVFNGTAINESYRWEILGRDEEEQTIRIKCWSITDPPDKYQDVEYRFVTYQSAAVVTLVRENGRAAHVVEDKRVLVP